VANETRDLRLRAVAAGFASLLAPCLITGVARADDTPVAGQEPDQEIVVTANRRDQTLGSVAASDSVFTAGQMQVLGVKTVADLVRFTPGVTYDYTTNDIAIRGIASAAGAGATGIYIDDTPIQMRSLDFNSNNALPSVFDLARVEVLRGPQGTLFGAGAEGGAIRYITVQPNLTSFSGEAHGELADTTSGAPSQEMGVAFGGPIAADVLGFRLSGWERHDGGWIDQVDSSSGQTLRHNANATDTSQVRAALSWAPSSRLLITAALTSQARDHKFYDQYWIALSDPSRSRFVSGTPDNMADHDRFYLPSVTIQYDFEGVQFTSSTAYFSRREAVNGYSGTLYDLSYFQQSINPNQPGGAVDPAFNPCPACRSDLYPLLTPDGVNLPGLPQFRVDATIFNAQSNFTQEFRLHSTNPNARLNWLIGVFYADQRQHSTDEAVDPYLPALAQYLFGESMTDIWGMGLLNGNIEYINDTKGDDRQVAAFFDATLNLTDKLRLNAGLRYARTHFDFVNHSDGPLNFGPAGGSGAQNESPLTPKVGLAYQFDADDLLYLSAAKGFRIGGANAPFPEAICQADLNAMQITSVPSSYKSDTVASYELGARSRLLSGRVSTDFSVFHAEWDGIQQSNYLPSCGFQYTANLGRAVSDGVDFEGRIKITPTLRLDFSAGYVDARYAATTRTGAAADAPILSAKGDSLGSPRWTLALGGQYEFLLAGNAAFARLEYAFTSGDPRRIPARDPVTSSYDPFLPAEPQKHFVSVRAGETIHQWEVDFFVDNLFDAHPRLNVNHQDQYTLLLEATTFRPRTAGLSVTYQY
jgi:outer membrane receptor protein involved in Fe transport